MLTVGKLKLLIADLEDSALVLIPGHNHNYFYTRAFVTTALFAETGSKGITQDYGEDVTPAKECGTRKIALVISE